MEHKWEFAFYFSGIGLQEPYNGNVVSVEQRNVNYDGQDLKNCVLVKYVVPKLDWKPQLSKEDITQLVISKSDIFVDTLSLLLINPCKLLIMKILVDGDEFEPKLPVQSISGLYNLLIERNKFAGSQSLTTLVHKTGWSILEELVTEFRNKSLLSKNKISLALRWYVKASNEYSSMDRFISYWISFNSIFGGLENSEQQSIEKYIERNIDLLMAQRFCANHQKPLSTLSTFQIQLRRRGQVSDDLNKLLNANVKDYISIMKMMALTIYGVRNNLFHGSYDPRSSQTQRHVVVAERLLSEFLKEIVAKEMLGYPLAPSVFRVQTKVGIGKTNFLAKTTFYLPSSSFIHLKQYPLRNYYLTP